MTAGARPATPGPITTGLELPGDGWVNHVCA